MAPKKQKSAAAASSAATSIEDLFTSLNRHIQRSDFQQAVKLSVQVLSIAPDDEDAFRSKIVALIKSDSIDQALSTVIQSSKKFPSDFKLFKYWSNAMTEDNKLNVIIQEAAAFKLKHGCKEEASHLYEELVKTHGSIEALVGLILTSADTNLEKAESYEKKLKPLPGLKAVDVDVLEKTCGAKHVENGGIGEAYEIKNKEKAKKKRKRKAKYPKGFEPDNPGPPPDPEWWLPKRERSSYRPKRKDKRAAQIRGSQGAVTKEAGSLKSNQQSNTKGASHTTVADQRKPSSKSSRKKSRN